MKKTGKIIIWVLVAAVAVAAALFFIFKGSEKPVLTYQVTVIQPTTISSSVTATGTVEPVKQVEVGTQVSGIISKIYVDFNSEVKEGQLIAELDRSVLEAELEASKANLNASKVEYDYQLKNYNRIKGLFEKELVSETEYESAEYSFSRAKYSYQQAQSNFSKAQTNLEYAMIYSPIDGVVLSKAVDEGQTVASGFSTPTLFTIAQNLKEMRVIADIDEADIGQVHEGQKVEFEVDAYPDEVFTGTVTQVRLEATTTSNVVTYEVVIDAPNPDLKLKPGLTATVNIYTVDVPDVLTVPVSALKWSPMGSEDNNGTTVWTLVEGKPVPVKVTKGISDGIRAEVSGPLAEGTEVIVGQSIVANGKEMEAPKKGAFSFGPPQPGNNKRTK